MTIDRLTCSSAMPLSVVTLAVTWVLSQLSLIVSKVSHHLALMPWRVSAGAPVLSVGGDCRAWSVDHCTMHFTRADEPPEIVHEYTYTIEMATAQGLTRNRNWQQMPLQMLRSRVLTMGLRATYPDAVSGIYSADEIADHTDMSDDERAAISAESLGEELKAPPSRAPRRQASRPPQPVAAPPLHLNPRLIHLNPRLIHLNPKLILSISSIQKRAFGRSSKNIASQLRL